METWHPLGPVPPKPPLRVRPTDYPAAKKTARDDDYAQFDKNVDLTPEDVLGLLSGDLTERDFQYRRDAIVHELRVSRMVELLAPISTRRLLDRYRCYGAGWAGDSDYEYDSDLKEVERNALKIVLGGREHLERHPRGPGKIRRQKLAKANRSQNKSKNR